MGRFSLSFDVDRGVPTNGDEWIKYRLLNRHNTIVQQGGADIDGDGKMEVFGNFDGVQGVGNPGDFRGFYEKYKATIQKKYPAFRAAEMFDQMVGRRAHPLVHNSMALADLRLRYEDAPLLVDEFCLGKFVSHSYGKSKKGDYDFDIRGGVGLIAYADLACAYIDAKQAFTPTATTETKVKTIIKAVGHQFRFVTRGKDVPCGGIYFDEALITAAILARQFDLSDVRAVYAYRAKLFLRYKKGNSFSYIDSKGRIFSHAELQKEMPQNAAKGVYMRTLEDRELIGMLLSNRGAEWMKLAAFKWDGSVLPKFATDVKSRGKFIRQGFADYERSVALVKKNPDIMTKLLSSYYAIATLAEADHKNVRVLTELYGWKKKDIEGAMQRSKDYLIKRKKLDSQYTVPVHEDCVSAAIFIKKPAKDGVEESFMDKYGAYAGIGLGVLAAGLITWRLYRGRWGR